MGRERCLLAATGATSSVTRTIDTPPTHGPVVYFNFVYSRRLRKFDTDVSFFWGGPRVACSNNDLVPPFLCATCHPPKQEEEAGFEIESTEAG
jgi:hypothetical protein